MLVLWWLLVGIGICWTGRSMVHVAAGYLWCEPKEARRRMYRWFVLELVVSAAIVEAARAVGQAEPMSLWLFIVLVLIAIAVSGIPMRQAADISAFGLPTGGEWMAQRLSGWFGEGNDTPIPVLFRGLTSRLPQLSVGNLARVLGAAATMAVVVATMAVFTPADTDQGGTPPGINFPLPLPPAAPKPQAERPFIAMPPPVAVPAYRGDKSLTYEQLCGGTEGGAVPGASADEWARAGLYDLVLGPPPHGFGGYVSGCLGVVTPVSDSFGTTAWAAGRLGGRLLSVALYSTKDGSCLVRGSAAQPVLDLLRRGVAVSCAGGHAFGPAGDGYLVTCRYGTYAFVRGQTSVGDGVDQPYVEFSPGASDAWSEAEDLAREPLLVASAVGNTYPLVTLTGGPTDFSIIISHGAVRLKRGSKTGDAIRTRAALSWNTTIS
jgi:hypothetical protein